MMSDIESSDELEDTVTATGPVRTTVHQCSEDAGHDPFSVENFRQHFHTDTLKETTLKFSEPPRHTDEQRIQLSKPCTSKEEACKQIQEACERDPQTKQLVLIVIGKPLPADVIEENYGKGRWAEIDEDKVEKLLDDTFAYLGCARLILRNPTVELLKAVITELLKSSTDYNRITTYFTGHGERGRFHLCNGSIHIVDEVIEEFNKLSIQHFHYFDCCRVQEKKSFTANCLKGDAAVIYATQAGHIAYTGEGEYGRGTSDGVGVFTREFASLVKTHEGDFEQFARDLGCKTKEELEVLDSHLDTTRCRAVWHSTNVKKVNFKEERETAFKPQVLEFRFINDGYTVEFTVKQPPTLVKHDKYVAKTHELQIMLRNSYDWISLPVNLVATPGEQYTHRVRIPTDMLGYEARFSVLTVTGDDAEFPSNTSELLQPKKSVKPKLHCPNKLPKAGLFRKNIHLSWEHILPPNTTAANDNTDLPQFDRCTIEFQKQNSREELPDVNDDEWEELSVHDVDQQNRTASLKLKPGNYFIRVCAKFEDGSVFSETKLITSPESFCSRRRLLLAITLVFILLIALGLALAVVFLPRELTQYQLYQKDIIECSTSNSILTRILYSHWNFQECPNGLENLYDDINATVIPLNGGKKNQQYEVVPIEGTFPSGCYSLPYPSLEPANVQNRYMVEDSTVDFDLCITPQQSSSTPFVIALFHNYTYFASYVRHGEEYDIQKKFELSLTHSGQRDCYDFSYTVERSTYLYFAFYTPVSILLNITTHLEERQYVDPSAQWKYRIRNRGHATAVPISLVHQEKILCHSNTNDLYRDRTHICATPELRIPTIIVIAGIGILCAGLTFSCYCGIKQFRKRKRRRRCCAFGRGNYRRLENTTVQQT